MPVAVALAGAVSVVTGVAVAEAVIPALGEAVGVSVGSVGVSEAVTVGVIVLDAVGVGCAAASNCTTRVRSATVTSPSALASAPGQELAPKIAATTALRSAGSSVPLQFASPATASPTAATGHTHAPTRTTMSRRVARRDATVVVNLFLVCIDSPNDPRIAVAPAHGRKRY